MKVSAIIDGCKDPSPGMFYVYTSPFFVNFLESEVQWKMSKDHVQQMRKEGCGMVAWRADLMMNGKSTVSRIFNPPLLIV
jgi:hypothetical protein